MRWLQELSKIILRTAGLKKELIDSFAGLRILPWGQRLGVVVEITSYFALLYFVLLGSVGFAFLSLLGVLLGAAWSGWPKDLLGVSRHKVEDLHKSIQLSKGMRLELYKVDGRWLAPALYKDRKDYGHYGWRWVKRWRWINREQALELEYSPSQWNLIVNSISNGKRCRVQHKFFEAGGEWVVIDDHDRDFSIRRADWDSLVDILSDEGIFSGS